MSDSSTGFLSFANQARSQIVEITPQELSRAKPLPVIIDVREADEYAQGHIAGAKLLSRGILEQKVDQLIPDFSTPLVVYCSRGERGPSAAEGLLSMGYQNVRSLKGGLQNWLESGGTVETSKQFQNPRRERSWWPPVRVG
jgi:sulfur-carrier protein adenylyltransferase/sulfurtransferase